MPACLYDERLGPVNRSDQSAGK